MVENTTKKEVYIEVHLNRKVYAGYAYVTTDNEHIVDLSGILQDGNEKAIWREQDIGFVYDYLKNAALWESGFIDNLCRCDYSGLVASVSDFVKSYNDNNLLKFLSLEWEGQYYYIGNCETHTLRTSEDETKEFTAPPKYWNSLFYCYDCDCYIEHDNYYGLNKCIFCHSKTPIDDYSNSHHLEPVLYGDTCNINDFAGLGFELEIVNHDKTREGHYSIARSLCYNTGLNDRELRYAWDGSVSGGFEIISQPHTVKDFWAKIPQWENMLSFLTNKGYKSHDAGCCGLHVHVSRNLLGKTEQQQDIAIAKIFTFFDNNWDNLVKISRRDCFDYCGKNYMYGYNPAKTKYKNWKKGSKGAGSHNDALNNRNRNTFEFRLGRGTLNKWSFFAWIDLVLTITKNAKRITVNKVESNDLLSWLAGIKESTAKYIYKRGAFKMEILELYPSIAWELDFSDNNN